MARLTCRWVGQDLMILAEPIRMPRNHVIFLKVRAALLNMDRGGLAEAVDRMLLLLSEARGSVE
jgi:hypothetical protein